MTQQPLFGKASSRLSHHCSLLSSLPYLFRFSCISHGGNMVPCGLCHWLLLVTRATLIPSLGCDLAPRVTCCGSHTRVKSNSLVTSVVKELQPYYGLSMLRSQDYSKDMFTLSVFHMGGPNCKKTAKCLHGYILRQCKLCPWYMLSFFCKSRCC